MVIVTDTRVEAMATEDTTARGRPSPRPLLLLRPTLRLMLMPTMEATMEAMAWAMVLAMLVLVMATEDTDLDTAMEAMVDTVWDTTERERPRLRLVMARTGAMATGPEDTTVMAMDTVSTTDKRSDENCQS